MSRRPPRRFFLGARGVTGYRGDVLGSLGGLAARRPRALVAGAVAFTLLGIFFGGTVTGRLTNGGLGDSSAASGRADALLQRATGSDPDSSLLAVVSPISRVPDVVSRLRSLGARSIVAPRAGQPARLVSRDGRSALVVAPRITEPQATRISRRVCRRLRRRPRRRPGDLESGRFDHDSDLKRAELIALPLLFLLSFLVFRGLVAATAAAARRPRHVAGALLGLRVASEMTSLSIYALNLSPGSGSGWRSTGASSSSRATGRSSRVHGPGAKALRETLQTAGRTVLFSSLTVAAALPRCSSSRRSFLRLDGPRRDARRRSSAPSSRSSSCRPCSRCSGRASTASRRARFQRATATGCASGLVRVTGSGSRSSS